MVLAEEMVLAIKAKLQDETLTEATKHYCELMLKKLEEKVIQAGPQLPQLNAFGKKDELSVL